MIKREENPWIQTYTGKKYHFLNPSIDEIDIEDVAHHLSNLCRFTGATKHFYSIAQHSYYVSLYTGFRGLMHDGPEAYISDMSSPLKYSGRVGDYNEIEDINWAVMAQKYHLPEQLPEDVKTADYRLLVTEKRDLLVRTPDDWSLKFKDYPPYDFVIEKWSPAKAKKMFLKQFDKLYNQWLNNLNMFANEAGS